MPQAIKLHPRRRNSVRITRIIEALRRDRISQCRESVTQVQCQTLDFVKIEEANRDNNLGHRGVEKGS